MQQRNVIYALAIVVLLGLGWTTRWEVTPVKGGDSIGGAFLLNRWTGALYWLRFDEKIEVKPVAK